MPRFAFEKFTGKLEGILSKGPLPIAIDFGTSSLKVLQLQAGDPPTLIAAAELPTPEDAAADPAKRLAFQIENLPALMKNAGFKGKRVACAIPAAQTFCKHLQVQPEAGIPLAALCAGAAAAQIGCNPGALICRAYTVFGATVQGGAGKQEVISVAVARSLITRLMDAVRACRLDPVAIHPEGIAVLRSFDHITRRDADANLTSLYLDIGSGTTSVLIAHGTDLVFAKTIHLGGRYIDKLASKQLNCDLADAHRQRLQTEDIAPAAKAPLGTAADGSNFAMLAAGMKKAGHGAPVLSPAMEGALATAVAEQSDQRVGKKPSGHQAIAAVGMAPQATPALDLTEAMETITDEVAMCIRYYESIFPGRKVDRTVFVGGESRHKGLCQHIAKTLKFPAHIADPLARVARAGLEPTTGVDMTSPQPGWAVAMGLCLSPTDL